MAQPDSTMALRGGLAVDPAGLAQLRSAAGRDDPEALLAAARQFEALLVGKMLESMRATVPENPLTGGRDVATFQSMLDSELAQELVGGGGFGLAEALVRELGGAAAEPTVVGEPTVTGKAALARYRSIAAEPERGVSLSQPPAALPLARTGH